MTNANPLIEGVEDGREPFEGDACWDAGGPGVCTRPAEHYGDHAAWTDVRLMARWPRKLGDDPDAEVLERTLRRWLDDDDAVDVARWIIEAPEQVADAAYNHHEHGGDERG